MNKIQIYPVKIKKYNYMIVYNNNYYLYQVHDVDHFMNIIRQANIAEERAIILKNNDRLFVGWKYRIDNINITANYNFYNVIVPDKIDVLETGIVSF